MNAESQRLQAQQDGGVYYDGRWMDVADRRSNFTGVYVACSLKTHSFKYGSGAFHPMRWDRACQNP